MRTLCKVGRDTRYATHGLAVKVLESALGLPDFLLLHTAKTQAEKRITTLQQFLSSLSDETFGVSY
jgi:uncharacterized protein